MHFYRSLRPVKAITFDLDDTLYNNVPVIQRALDETHAFLQAWHPALQRITQQEYQLLFDRLREQEPEIYHDVTEWRRRAVVEMMLKAGLTTEKAEKGSHAVMAHFCYWRSLIDVPAETHQILARLGSHVPLVAITNGNVQPHRFGLAGHFRFILRAGLHGRAKPYQDMYLLAAEKLNLSPENILHVGDDLTTDVAGSVCCGMQSCWINLHDSNLMKSGDSRLLPHLEISELETLITLFE